MKRIVGILLTLVLVLGMTACSSGSSGKSENNANSENSEKSESSSTSEPIKIALVAPLSGNYANIGSQFKEGVDLKAKEVNDAGGIDGKKVEIVYFDDKADPKEAASIAQRIASDNSILAVIGHYTSSACYAGIPIYEKADLAMITPSASHPDLTKDNTTAFKMWTGFDVYAPKLADLVVKEQGKKNIAVLYAYNDWGIGVKDYFVNRAKELGASIVAEEVLYDGDKDFKTQLTNIKAKNPDALAIITYYAEGAVIAQQVKGLGINTQLYGTGTFYEDQFLEMAGEYSEGMYAINEFVADDPRDSVKQFMESYKKVNPNGVPGNYQGNAYDSLGVLLHSYKNTGASRKQIKEGLSNLKGYVGVTGEITFAKQEVRKPQIYIKLENGVWKFHKLAE